MEIVINGRFLSQRPTGVQRVACECTLALDRLLGEGRFPGVRARLVVPSDARPMPAPLSEITVEVAPGAGGHAWEQLVLPGRVRGGHLLCLGNSAPALSLIGRKPVAVMLHDQAYRTFPADYSLAYRAFHYLLGPLILRRARPLLLVSESERRVLAQRQPRVAQRAVVVPNGSWTQDGPQQAELAQPTRPVRSYGLFLGRPDRRKNIDAVLAVAIDLARARGLPFRIVGPGTEALRDRIPAELRQLVTVTAAIADHDLPALYLNAAYLLYPSFYEASGLPPSEAMSFGCPVVTADLPALRERCGDAALFCDPHDPQAVRAAVVQLLDDPVATAARVQVGYDRVRHMTWRTQAALIVSAMRAAAAGSSRAVAAADPSAAAMGPG